MTTTARFELQRKEQLKKLFTRARLIKIWRALVKEQMRRQNIKDLHDYYDFNFNIEARVDVIIDKVLSGGYRAEIPLVFKAEKKLGICRHMLVPTPSDALVFQTLTEQLYKSVIKSQPSKNAYYARDRHNLRLPHELDQASNYPWFILWPQFQKDILKFTKSHKYLVMTDLLNYYDNIGIRELRNIISEFSQTKEVYLDLLFSLIEDLSWTPDYLPKLHKGLLTINIEAPRLLAHTLLFEVDYLLKRKTKDNFVRWMDDINFGVDTTEKASIILGDINDVLKSRGLGLNLAKTFIISSDEAESHFLFRENVRLSKIANKAKGFKKAYKKRLLAHQLARELKSHFENCSAKNKDKVTKRFFTILGTLQQPVALNNAVLIFKNNSVLRESVLRYLEKLPFSGNTTESFISIMDNTSIYDDITLFMIIEAIVRWGVPFNKKGRAFAKEIRRRLKKPKDSFTWFCSLYFLAKYGLPNEVMTAVANSKKCNAKDVFFARQRMAVLPRTLKWHQDYPLKMWNHEIASGPSDSASVAINLKRILEDSFPTKNDKLYQYLFPKDIQFPYPLPKFLILCVLAASDIRRGANVKRDIVSLHVKDPWYRHWLYEINKDWF